VNANVNASGTAPANADRTWLPSAAFKIHPIPNKNRIWTGTFTNVTYNTVSDADAPGEARFCIGIPLGGGHLAGRSSGSLRP